MQVDVQRLATSLPLHLLALVVSTGTEPRFRYLLRGVRLLHSLSDLALRYPKLEQVRSSDCVGFFRVIIGIPARATRVCEISYQFSNTKKELQDTNFRSSHLFAYRSGQFCCEVYAILEEPSFGS